MNDSKDARIEILEKRITKLESMLTDEIAGLDKRTSTNVKFASANADAIRVICDRLPNIWDGIEKAHARLDDAWKLCALADERLKILEKHDECYKNMFEHSKAMIDVHTDQIQSLQRDMMQMRDVYYHVFPERAVQDVRFMDQLDAIISKPNPGADPEKS
jgi:hypothetical protein